MNSYDYEFISGFLKSTSGLALGPGKEYLVESRLVPLAGMLGLADFQELVRELRKGENRQLQTAVTEAMTTNESTFFRDKIPFDDLKNTLIPELIRARANVKKLRFWCSASSTGQEPYSLLMLLEDCFPELRQWQVDIVASDIAQSMIDRCRSGFYSHFEVQRGLPTPHLIKHFAQVPGGWQINPELRQRIDWRLQNLLDRFDHLGQFDIVLCRNVLIYFDVPTKKQVLERIAGSLKPDGYLLLGAAETVLGICERFDRYRSCVSPIYAPATPVALTASA